MVLRILKSVILLSFFAAGFSHAALRTIPAGSYKPFLKPAAGAPPLIVVNEFTLDTVPVSKNDFLKFVKANPEWRKSKVKRLFADEHYLQDWTSDLHFAAKQGNSPVTFVSWFAASAYCKSLGKDLPTTDQWEYAAADSGRDKVKVTEQILKWYSRPNTKALPDVGKSLANGFGIYDLFGLVWEWTLDFGDSSSSDDGKRFCGGAGAAAADPSDYANFMRYSFRESLEAKYALANLGFRCAGGKL